jgi:hypothetical protein
MKFNVNEKRLEERDLTIDERLLFMGQESDLLAFRDLLAWFMVDVDGNYLPEAIAKRTVGGFRKAELAEAGKLFWAGVRQMLVPKESASSSKPDSDTTA